jgi:hypothetical protein
MIIPTTAFNKIATPTNYTKNNTRWYISWKPFLGYFIII